MRKLFPYECNHEWKRCTEAVSFEKCTHGPGLAALKIRIDNRPSGGVDFCKLREVYSQSRPGSKNKNHITLEMVLFF